MFNLRVNVPFMSSLASFEYVKNFIKLYRESDLKEAIISYENVCVDGNIITSRGVGTTIEFALAIIEILTDGQNAENIAKSIVYNK